MPGTSQRVSVFGLGYVGAVTAACLADTGHTVVGIDVNATKLETLGRGESPIVERGLEELLSSGVASGRLRFTADHEAAVAETDVSFVSVGTPSDEHGALQTDHVERVCQQIGNAIATKGTPHLVVIRSTVLPGTTDGLLIPILEHAVGSPIGDAFDVVYNPEFMREGTSIDDFHHPPFTIIGHRKGGDGAALRTVYEGVNADVVSCSIPAAEAVKYGSNIFHATKITFANEIAALCHALDVDSREVMDLVVTDTKLNVSAKYMRPGMPFGGSCLPKDLRAFVNASRAHHTKLPMLEAILTSNRLQVERIVGRVRAAGSRRVALFGLSFKEGTDDLRESPLVALAELLIGQGTELSIVDPDVEYSSLHGSNKAFLDQELPHVRALLCTPEVALAESDTLVFAHGSETFRSILRAADPRHHVIDLVGLDDEPTGAGTFEGLYW